MKGIIEKIKRNKLVSSIGLIIIILLIVIVVLLATGTVGIKRLSIDNQEAAAIESGLIVMEETEPVAEVLVKNTETVTFPVFASGDMFDYDGAMSSCDSEVVWVTAEVEPTPAILNATLKKMFDFKNDPNYIPYNFVGEQENLSFMEARIEDGIAKIYLEGEINIKDACDADKPWIQLEDAALLFDTVDGVQIFLNDELIR